LGGGENQKELLFLKTMPLYLLQKKGKVEFTLSKGVVTTLAKVDESPGSIDFAHGLAKWTDIIQEGGRGSEKT